MKRLLIINLLLLFANSLFGINDKIYSIGSSSPETLALFLSSGNEELGDELTIEFATVYIEEAKKEGINWDVAFVQMCLETGFLSYGGLVVNTQNNFCGLGSFDGKQGASFSTIPEGVRAHIQHLKAYSTTDSLNGALIDPRFNLVKRGIAISVHDLAGRWATDPAYGKKLFALLKRVEFLGLEDKILLAEVPIGGIVRVKPTEIIYTSPLITPEEDIKPEAQNSSTSGWAR
ncbi:MAG: glucosaminidase domain-containing protein [Spirochaetaceae bacterium]